METDQVNKNDGIVTQVVFDYLKKNLSVSVRSYSGQIEVTIMLNNPSTGLTEEVAKDRDSI